MKDAKYERKGKTIKDLESNESKTYDSINLAKKDSRSLQGTSGDGTLRVIK